MAKKPSFFSRLTGSSFENDFDSFEEVRHQPHTVTAQPAVPPPMPAESEAEAQLTVDVYQNDDEIVIRALVAGVRPDDLDISISRDMVTIYGKRSVEQNVEDSNYVYRELYWGAFSRTVVLPAEIDVDMAAAEQKHGLLTIHLPKINKDRQTKLKVRG